MARLTLPQARLHAVETKPLSLDRPRIAGFERRIRENFEPQGALGEGFLPERRGRRRREKHGRHEETALD